MGAAAEDWACGGREVADEGGGWKVDDGGGGSGLAGRWKKVWTQVSVLDFTDVPEYYRPLCDEAKICYNNFVDKVLVENNTSYLQRFCYEFSCDDDSERYESWLNSAKRREYFEIDLDFTLGGSRSHRFIELIYGKRVTVLKLTGVKICGTPEFFHLPCLKVVHLIKVKFNGNDYMKRLTSNCPSLRKFFIKECTGLDDLLYVESLTLKSLEICDIVSQALGRSLSINIKAPNLEYLSFDDEVTHYMVDSLDLLTQANLNLRDNFPVRVNEYGSNYDTYQDINYLINKASKVDSLRLKTSEFFINERELPTSGNLTRLEVKDDGCTYELLKQTPKLKSLIFEEVEWIDDSLSYLAEDGCISSLKHITVFLDNVCQG
ncbi:F-box/LRR-repeat protein 13-like [Chenopodium quinoa]|uniref:F-box/LRR-repeat protein 13-like n=1 Tax=Chenopodium quinoa TaxID=63459 RepID=UPI000B77C113|nr:F-box/LRR-repeat protein 13-like [Chenopodium quinoa]